MRSLNDHSRFGIYDSGRVNAALYGELSSQDFALYTCSKLCIFNLFLCNALEEMEMAGERKMAVPQNTETGAIAAIELSGAARRFGRRWALRGVSLEVAAGEAVALVGANGSGKTTLLRIVATGLRPTRGSCRVFGRDIVGEADAVRPLVGVLGHQPGLYEDLSATENLRFSVAMRGHAPAAGRVASAIERVGLADVADERVRGFSSGMRRRLALARLIIEPPRLLLLDEPYASFDAEGVDVVNAFILEVLAGGGTTLVATHDLDRGAGVLDRLVRLEAGAVIEDRRSDLPAARGPYPLASRSADSTALAGTARAGAGGRP